MYLSFISTMVYYSTYFSLILTCILGALTIYIKWSLTYWKRKHIPHLTPTFPFGNLKNPIINDPDFNRTFRSLYLNLKKLGTPVGGIYLFTAPFLLVVDPNCIKQVLIKSFRNFHERRFYSNEKYQPVSVNLLRADGPKWRDLRTRLVPVFSSAKMKLMCDLMAEVSKSMEVYVEECITAKLPLNVTNLTKYFASDIIKICVFGLECHDSRNDEFNTVIEELAQETTNSVKVAFYFAFPDLAKFLGVPLLETKGTAYMCNLIDETIKRRREDGSSRNDFLQILLKLRDDCIIDDTETKAQCLLYFLAGYETMSSVLTFALFELALDQDVQEKLRCEIIETLGANDGITSYEAVLSMKYLEMVVCEVLRKYPVIPLIKRRCVEDITVSNLTVKRNTDILVPIIGLHYDPEYFPNPEKFDPERFSDENKVNIAPYSYIPFSEGPRNCIGERFAKQELKVGMLSIIRKYRITLDPGVELPLKFMKSVIIKPETDILLHVTAISK